MIKKSILIIVMTLSLNQVQAKNLNSLWQQSFFKNALQLATTTELEQVEKAIDAELNGHKSDLWSAVGMQRLVDEELLIFKEVKKEQRGRGLYMLNTGLVESHILLQAPHAKADRYTGELAEQLFFQGNFHGVQWNSVYRYSEIEGMSAKADMAHLEQTYWQVFTRTFANKFAQARIVQLHGYARSKRKSKQGKTSDMILSSGDYFPSPWIQQVAICLKESIPGRVSLFPYDINELGATRNTQGKLLRSLKHKGFLHIEMSLELRKLFLEKTELRQVLLECLKG